MITVSADASQSPPPSRIDIGGILARNTVWNYLGFAVNMATNFLLFPYVVGTLGSAAAGIWLLLGSLTGYMGLMELGIVPALTQRIASALARGDREAVHASVSTSVVLMLVMMTVAAQVAWFAPVLVDLLHLPAGLEASAVMVVRISILGVAVRMPQAPFQAVLLGCQRQDRCSHLWIVLAITKALLTVLLLSLGYGVVAVVLMEALAHVAAGVLQVRWVWQELPSLRLGLRWASLDEARHLTSFGLQVMVSGIFVLIVEQSDRFVIAAFRPIEDVTRYSAAWKLYMLAYTIPTTLVQAVSPLVASLYGSGEDDRLRALFLRMTKYSTAVALPLSVGIAVGSGWILQAWMGPEFGDVHPTVMVLLASLLVTGYNHAGYSIVYGTRQVGRQLWVYNAPLAVLNFGLSVWLVQRFGIVGVALGTAIPALLLEYPFMRLVLGSLHLSFREFGRAVVRPTLGPVLWFLPQLAVFALLGPYSLWHVAVGLMSGLAYVTWFWRRELSGDERQQVLVRAPWLPQSAYRWLT